MTQLSELSTEQINSKSAKIDQMSTREILNLINEEDAKVSLAVKEVIPEIEAAVDGIHPRMQAGGRLIYIGSGTSGRLGVLDAAECPPTFGVSPDEVCAIMAGGPGAMFVAVEGAEDDEEQGRKDIAAMNLTPNDTVLGIAASGRTPYVLGALDYAKQQGCFTCSLSCAKDSLVAQVADVGIVPLAGPEVITGSTRMKSGTCQKLVLNMISTTLMIKKGKVFGNLMVDVKASNKKLYERAIRIVSTVTGASEEVAKDLLEQADMHAKTAIVMYWHHMDADQARLALKEAGDQLSAIMPKA